MADSRPSTADEKSEPIPSAALKRKSFFSRKKPSTIIDENVDEKDEHGNTTTEVTPTVPAVPPISFFQLFRSVELLFVLRNSILTLLLDTPQNLSSFSMLSV